MPEVKEVIASLRRMSTYYKSMMAVGSQEDIEIYTSHREVVNKAIELLGEQQNQITMMKMIYGDFGTVVGELVRCKDCKHKEESVSPYGMVWCSRLHCGCCDDWYCADGERK